jgi:hypothetical protein
MIFKFNLKQTIKSYTLFKNRISELFLQFNFIKGI